MENQEGEIIVLSAPLSTNSGNEIPMTPMSEQSIVWGTVVDGCVNGGGDVGKNGDSVDGDVALPPTPSDGITGLPINTSPSSGGGSFTQEIYVNPEDDVIDIIKRFAVGHRNVIILSATGSFSHVSVRTSGSLLEFKGMFEILNLNGAFINGENNIPLNLTFFNAKGKVYGGQVEGMMIATTPITIIAWIYDHHIPIIKLPAAVENCETLEDVITETQHWKLSPSIINPTENDFENGVKDGCRCCSDGRVYQ